MRGFLLRLVVTLILVGILAVSPAYAASLIATRDAAVLLAPVAGAPEVAKVEQGTLVEVTHQAGAYWRVQLPDGKAGYVTASALKQVQTRGGPLIPLLVMAAAPILKVVFTGVIKFFKKLLGISDATVAQADQVLSLGQEAMVVANNPAGWLQVKLANGQVGYVQQSPQVVPLQPVQYAPSTVNTVYQGAQPIPQTATGLTLFVEVRRPDGTPVPAGSTLRIGDEYLIYVTPSADCFVRITCETPDFNHVFQYYPNQFPGTQTSAFFRGGYTYSAELLPQGIKFKVSEPIGRQDILRIEATTAGPFTYVPEPVNGMPTVRFRGGGFSVSGNVVNPTAQVVVEYPINTTR